MAGACGRDPAVPPPGCPPAGPGYGAAMTEPTDAPQPPADASPGEDAREPADSPQRRLVETVAAYEVDPPAPARAREEQPGT